MLVEKNLKEALEYYIKGKPVTALWIGEDGSMKICSWNVRTIITRSSSAG